MWILYILFDKFIDLNKYSRGVLKIWEFKWEKIILIIKYFYKF